MSWFDVIYVYKIKDYKLIKFKCMRSIAEAEGYIMNRRLALRKLRKIIRFNIKSEKGMIVYYNKQLRSYQRSIKKYKTKLNNLKQPS